MKNFLEKFAYKIRNFMIGRYGVDRLWRALLVLYLISIVITNIVYRFSRSAYYVLSVLTFALIAFAVYRVFSKNIEARRKENDAYIRAFDNAKNKFTQKKNMYEQRKTHKFVKCRSCKKVLRLPKNKGKLNVTCPHCNNHFVVNTGKKM